MSCISRCRYSWRRREVLESGQKRRLTGLVLRNFGASLESSWAFLLSYGTNQLWHGQANVKTLLDLGVHDLDQLTE